MAKYAIAQCAIISRFSFLYHISFSFFQTSSVSLSRLMSAIIIVIIMTTHRCSQDFGGGVHYIFYLKNWRPFLVIVLSVCSLPSSINHLHSPPPNKKFHLSLSRGRGCTYNLSLQIKTPTLSSSRSTAPLGTSGYANVTTSLVLTLVANYTTRRPCTTRLRLSCLDYKIQTGKLWIVSHATIPSHSMYLAQKLLKV